MSYSMLCLLGLGFFVNVCPCFVVSSVCPPMFCLLGLGFVVFVCLGFVLSSVCLYWVCHVWYIHKPIINVHYVYDLLYLMSGVCCVQCLFVQGLSCLVFVCLGFVIVPLKNTKHKQHLKYLVFVVPYVQGLLCLLFVCLGFVMYSASLSRVCHVYCLSV